MITPAGQWTRKGNYITARDGTRLAAFVYFPKDWKKCAPLPVIWTHDRYHCISPKKNKELNGLLSGSDNPEDNTCQTHHNINSALVPWLQEMMRESYIVAFVDVRGSGASFGSSSGPFSPEEGWDSYDITEWFAAQPWCSGNIGMFGRSYKGVNQYFAASTQPPHLKAIFPEMAMCDLYSFAYTGGIFRNAFAREWGKRVEELDLNENVERVDNDVDGSLLSLARKEHRKNPNVHDLFQCLPYRDSCTLQGCAIYEERSPISYCEAISQSGVAICHLAGWYDMWPKDALLWFQNLRNPQKIIIGPWAHGGLVGEDLAHLHIRWFDYWLKGEENGVMDEAPIAYHVAGVRPDKAWKTTWYWPLLNQVQRRLYFCKDASLSESPDNDDNAVDDYHVDYSATSGKATRWSNGYGEEFDYPNMASNDAKGVTYTSNTLEEKIEVTGHPIVNLYVTTTASDGDFFVYLEDIYPDGYVQYVTEGCLRLSHRHVQSPPYSMLNLPYHKSGKEIIDIDKPIKLDFDLLPLSYVFASGHQIRVTITCADSDNALTPICEPSPTVSIYRCKKHPSLIMLPII